MLRHGDLSDDICGATHVGFVFRIWEQPADNHNNRFGVVGLDDAERDLGRADADRWSLDSSFGRVRRRAAW